MYERVEELEALLSQSECPAGDINIRAAINAYRYKQIKCWDKWTLIYSGYIVDTCPSFESFSHDREKRMDRYYEEHGEGWLWYEPPLVPSGGSKPEHMLAATWGEPRLDSSGQTGTTCLAWTISMGFRRVHGFHSRFVNGTATSTSATSADKVPPYSIQKYISRRDGHTKTRAVVAQDDPQAPRCVFMMHLDSGASLPSLRKVDLPLLGIDPKAYPAQSLLALTTANGTVHAPIYELRADVCRHNGESLVGDNPVWPNERHDLGGIVPVSVLAMGQGSDALCQDIEERLRKGAEVSEEALAKRSKLLETRLSGMLPFQVCYSGGAPGLPLWFGEDRRDVLGADRMPGQRRWEVHRHVKGERKYMPLVGRERPSIRFEHQIDDHKTLIDTDVPGLPGASVLTLVDETKNQSYWHEPGGKRTREAIPKPKIKRPLSKELTTLPLPMKRPRYD